MKRHEKTIHEIATLMTKLDDFISAKGKQELDLTNRELEIITLTKMLYNTDKEAKKDKLIKQMIKLIDKSFDLMTMRIDSFISKLKEN